MNKTLDCGQWSLLVSELSMALGLVWALSSPGQPPRRPDSVQPAATLPLAQHDEHLRQERRSP